MGSVQQYLRQADEREGGGREGERERGREGEREGGR